MWRLGIVVFALALTGTRAAADLTTDEALEALRSPDSRVRAEGAARLAEARTRGDRERALRALFSVITDAAPDVRASAATALEEIGDRRAAKPVAARLRVERDPRVLAALLLALGRVGSPAEVEGVAIVAQTHALPSVRAAALTALGQIGGDRARQVVLEALCTPGLPDPDWALRASALLALARCGNAGDVGTALTAYRKGGGRHHWFARSALAKLHAEKDPDPLPALGRLALDRDPRVALTAALGIARRGGESAIAGLLRHPSSSVRVAAATAIGRERLEASFARLKTLAQLDPARRVRWAAALALFEAEEVLGDELVLAGLASREPVVWAEAIAALASRTGENHGRDVRAWRGSLRRWRRQR